MLPRDGLQLGLPELGQGLDYFKDFHLVAHVLDSLFYVLDLPHVFLDVPRDLPFQRRLILPIHLERLVHLPLHELHYLLRPREQLIQICLKHPHSLVQQRVQLLSLSYRLLCTRNKHVAVILISFVRRVTPLRLDHYGVAVGRD